MKTTEEMHAKYYDKLFEETDFTRDAFDKFNYRPEKMKVIVSAYNYNCLSETGYEYMLQTHSLIEFVIKEEERVNKKWRKKK